MLWNVIYEFFIKYIFGGRFSTRYDTYGAFLGTLKTNAGDYNTFNTYDIDAISFNYNGSVYYLSLGNYLSLIATIITLVIILVLCGLLIKKIYNICAHVIG